MKAVNLLPPELRGAGKPAAGAVSESGQPGRVGAFALLGVLAFCVVALAGYVVATNTVKQREAELAQVTADAQATVQRAAELKPYADFETMARTRIQTVKDLASSRFDWEQGLRDISRAIPASVTLKQLNGTISSGAGGGSVLRAAISAPAMELTGCTTTQTAVATLMSRLRNVDGVTRVTLASSEKPVPAGAASVAPTDDGCGRGEPPAFSLVIFFERSDVPATVEDVTVQAAAGTPGTAPAGGEEAPATTGEQPPAATPAADGTVPADPQGTPASTTNGAG